MNSLGGILATTSNTNNEANSADAASTPGSLKGLWKILDQSGYILNWNGEVSTFFRSSLHSFEENYSYHNALLVITNCTPIAPIYS